MIAVETDGVVLGAQVAEGKTKTLYDAPQLGDRDGLVYMVHKDAITAGDGAKRDVLEDKGELSCRTTSAVFQFLANSGINSHYHSTVGTRTMLVQRVEMVPIEWVARRLAAGSYVRRTGVTEGTRFDNLVLELFLKDDERHDPLITRTEAIELGLCTSQEIDAGLTMTARIFETLEAAWSEQDISLVDLKIEFGRTSDGLLLADVIDNDSWRLWPGGRRDLMLDKQVYRELADSSPTAMDDVHRRYVEVAKRTEQFSTSQPDLVTTTR